MKIANYIQDLLYRYECVILPGFGAFLSQKEPAYIDKKSEVLHPPKKVVSFNSQLKKNDGLLANYIAATQNVSYSTAVNKITEFVGKLEESFKEDGKVELENIGRFYYAEEKLQFEPVEKVNYLTDSFGLENVKASAISREVYKKQVEELEEKAPIHFTPERRKSPAYLKYAAIGLIALGISGFAGLNIYSSQVSKHNIAEQQQAQEQLQEQIQQATFIIDNPLPAVTFNVAKQTGNYHIVAGAFRVEENAKTKVAELRKEGFKAHLLGENKYGLHQVVYASHEKRRDAINMLRKVKSSNEGAWLLVQEL
ncbi:MULTISPECIES: SPOR domain-containing protein [Salegentibacter]|jgi:nucleoid DNA-binding protein|uniref:Sporulation related domain-containing protein n=2 Tax=Salegentibacter TaxID=143222 RepID=A0A1I2M6X0_9FLAO|nr:MULTISPECIES: SPOR domain-containing protein [Salegentibacter]APS38234.1 sporulation protein [Salegentibacter sp. T436]SFF84951.1 Sporulation related domain-containing protein [Salegentibacter agarivorans]